MRHFADIELRDDRTPYEASILSLSLLQSHRLTEQLFAEVSSLLADQEITPRSGATLQRARGSGRISILFSLGRPREGGAKITMPLFGCCTHILKKNFNFSRETLGNL